MASSCKNQRRFYRSSGVCNRDKDWAGIKRTETGESTFHYSERNQYIHCVAPLTKS